MEFNERSSRSETRLRIFARSFLFPCTTRTFNYISPVEKKDRGWGGGNATTTTVSEYGYQKDVWLHGRYILKL